MPCPYEGMVMERLLKKITDRTAHVAVIGLGYVGLPLAVGFAKTGYHVTGIDVDAGRVGRLKNTPRVVGGITPTCRQAAVALYSQVVDKVVPVSSTEAAEMTKLLENTFRIVNIGLVNEIAIMCDRLGINVWEVVEAASTKPYGFIQFYPGPGL